MITSLRKHGFVRFWTSPTGYLWMCRPPGIAVWSSLLALLGFTPSKFQTSEPKVSIGFFDEVSALSLPFSHLKTAAGLAFFFYRVLR